MLEATYFDLDELLACMHPQNAKEHDVGAIGLGIDDLGFIERVVRNWRTLNVVAGHGRIITLAEQRADPNGERPDEIEYYTEEGPNQELITHWLIPGDWCELSPAKELRALATLNQTTIAGGWDEVKLVALLSEVLHEDGPEKLQATGFDEQDLDALIMELEQQSHAGGDKGGAAPEQAPALAEKWGVSTGQLWKLGNHRVICGDATDERIVARVLGGRKVDIVLADPPYSSGGFQDGQKRQSSSIGTRQGASIARDNMTSRGYTALIARVLANVDAEAAYLFCDWRMWATTSDVLESSGYPVRNMLVWDKQSMGMGFPWRNEHELIAFAKRSAAKMLSGDKGNVLQAARSGNENHPTEKPVDLLTQILENTEGRTVYDPFGGSGSTLIACEQMARKCRIVEVSPAYVAVILQRWSEMTEHMPELVES
jgi:DNA modification methylase